MVYYLTHVIASALSMRKTKLVVDFLLQWIFWRGFKVRASKKCRTPTAGKSLGVDFWAKSPIPPFRPFFTLGFCFWCRLFRSRPFSSFIAIVVDIVVVFVVVVALVFVIAVAAAVVVFVAAVTAAAVVVFVVAAAAVVVFVVAAAVVVAVVAAVVVFAAADHQNHGSDIKRVVAVSAKDNHQQKSD